MTTEPKFVPKEAAEISLGDGLEAKIRLIDCVGYMVEGAVGHEEDNVERMVKTPWFDYEIPFTQAAEIGTRKVITDHSTIGIVVTADGSFGDLPREAYIPAEEKTIQELKTLGKPFIVLLNCEKPYADGSLRLAGELEEKYDVSVLPVNCEQLKKEDVTHILSGVLEEFPITEVDFKVPRWMEILSEEHPLKAELVEAAKVVFQKGVKIKDIRQGMPEVESENLLEVRTEQVDLSNGTISMEMVLNGSCYFDVMSEETGLEIHGEYDLFRTLREMSSLKNSYEKVQEAMELVQLKGFGVVSPEQGEVTLDEPTVVKHGNKYGVRLHATAPVISLIRANIETEMAPLVGSEQQANDLIAYIHESSEEKGIWSANIFGKNIQQIVEEGIQTKINQMTDDCQMKLQDTMQKIINDSNGGIICFII
jgi:stage IV sporulation protein A